MSESTTTLSGQAAGKADTFMTVLRNAGMRITAQRRAVCTYLAETDTHPSAYQVFDALSAANPDISRATVYNTLNTLRDLGAIVEISVGADHTHYDTDTSPHINLICLTCNQVMDYHGTLALDVVKEQIIRDMGFVAVAGKVELMGFCQTCRERKRDEIRQQAAE
jgi:Fur family peroxide stress response transcriptional regulator